MHACFASRVPQRRSIFYTIGEQHIRHCTGLCATSWRNRSSGFFCQFFSSFHWKFETIRSTNPQVSRAAGSIEVGCMEMNDRPFQMQVFEERGGHGRRILVIGAHFTHYRWYSSMRRAIARVTTATGVEHTILIADTNIDASTSSRSLMSMIGMPWASRSVDSDLHRTCCLNDGHFLSYDK